MNRLLRVFFTLIPFLGSPLQADPYPIAFCVPEEKIVSEIPEKTRDFAHLIPGNLSTYIYTSEEEYYKAYQCSYYAITTKKSGWDCLRHYEILANGCIPYFPNIEQCNPQTMFSLPKELILEGMNIPGVSYNKIDHEKFDQKKYYEVLDKLLEYTREHLTTKQMAQYVLDTVGYSGTGNILFLSGSTSPDYLRCLLLSGFKELLQDRVIDYPKISHIYKGYQGARHLYGRGFTYTNLVEDLPIDRDNLPERILNKEFDLIIYGSVHRGCPLLDLVTKVYSPDEIVYFCGEDCHHCEFTNLYNFFLREF